VVQRGGCGAPGAAARRHARFIRAPLPRISQPALPPLPAVSSERCPSRFGSSRAAPRHTRLRLWMTRWRRDVVKKALLGRLSPSNFGHHCAWRTYGSRKRLRMSANVRPAMRPSRLAVSWGSLFLLTRPASNSANQARNLANSAGGSRRIASSISSTVMAAGIARRPESLKNSGRGNPAHIPHYKSYCEISLFSSGQSAASRSPIWGGSLRRTLKRCSHPLACFAEIHG
jgi:hypothetical protein